MNAAVLDEIAVAAKAQVDRDIARGVAALIREPWRANRILPHATSMSVGALMIELARRLPHATDLNRKIGMLQLRTAFAVPEFLAAWEQYRAREAE